MVAITASFLPLSLSLSLHMYVYRFGGEHVRAEWQLLSTSQTKFCSLRYVVPHLAARQHWM